MGFLIDMINVGEGDSFLLTLDTPAGGEAYVLIDAGLPEQGENVVRYLRQYALNGLDLVIATHLDSDHIGGLLPVAKSLPIGKFAINVPPSFTASWFGFRKQLDAYRKQEKYKRLVEAVELTQDLLAILQKRGVKIIDAVQERCWTCGEIRLNVLNPTPQRLQEAWEDAGLVNEIRQQEVIAHILAGTRQPAPLPPNLLEVLAGAGKPAVVPPPVPFNPLLGPPQQQQIPLAALIAAAAARKSEAPATSAENDASIVLEVVYKGVPHALLTSDAGAAVLKEVTHGKLLPVP